MKAVDLKPVIIKISSESGSVKDVNDFVNHMNTVDRKVVVCIDAPISIVKI